MQEIRGHTREYVVSTKKHRSIVRCAGCPGEDKEAPRRTRTYEGARGSTQISRGVLRNPINATRQQRNAESTGRGSDYLNNCCQGRNAQPTRSPNLPESPWHSQGVDYAGIWNNLTCLIRAYCATLLSCRSANVTPPIGFLHTMHSKSAAHRCMAEARPGRLLRAPASEGTGLVVACNQPVWV